MRSHKLRGKVNLQGTFVIEFTDGSYAGIPFSYNDVSFTEDSENDKLKISFKYDIHAPIPDDFNKQSFEHELGDFLVECIYESLKNNTLGSIKNEDREDDSFESDS